MSTSPSSTRMRSDCSAMTGIFARYSFIGALGTGPGSLWEDERHAGADPARVPPVGIPRRVQLRGRLLQLPGIQEGDRVPCFDPQGHLGSDLEIDPAVQVGHEGRLARPRVDVARIVEVVLRRI